MGYTHYWTKNRTFTDAEWTAITEGTRKILRVAQEDRGIALSEDYDVNRIPVVDDSLIRFNGYGDEGHETFYFDRRVNSFEFCKTDRKEYDVAVAAILMYVRDQVSDFSWRSDGWVEEQEIQDAVKLVNEACGVMLEISNADPNSADPYYKDK